MLLSMDEFRAFEPKKTTYALFGWPLGHTMSPELHAQLFEVSGQDADYIGVAVPPEDLPEAFELAKRKLGGINCTIPHKKAVIPLLDEIDTAARDLHSVNTVRFADGKATGFNTDILGFAESLNRDGVSLQGKKVLLLGYGGAASVMAYHCVTQGAYLTITGRNLEKAETLQKQLTDAVPGARISVFSRRHIPRDIHIVLNSTPVGMYPKENAAPLHYLPHKTEYVFDAIYNPPVTSTMKLANPRKTKTRDGLFMLVMQAAHAQTIWTGVTFEPQACETILRRTYGKMAVKRLRELKPREGGRLIGALTPPQVARQYKGWCKRYSLPHVPARNLRHSWATNTLAAGADIAIVSKMLGHSDIKTTAKYYLKPDISALRDAQRLWERALIA